MATQHSSLENKSIRNSWYSFVEEGKLSSDIEQRLKDSWIRSRDAGVSPYSSSVKKVSEQELAAILRKNAAVIEIATPFMQQVYHFLKGSGLVVSLSDSHGILLKVIGDQDVIDATHGNMEAGTDWSEQSAGANSTGTTLLLDTPTMFHGFEHFSRLSQRWVGSGAPVHDAGGNVIGCLNISGEINNAHKSLLGMTVITAQAIDMQICQRGVSPGKRAQKSYEPQTAELTFEDIIGQDASLLEMKKLARAAASTDANVLLLGETGSGKEIFAQAIHNASPRANGPFVAINCAAVPADLLASTLFGYEGGAFTGARHEGMIGKFEQADHGTLFLDEIGELSAETQAILLRVLDSGAFTRIGGKYTKTADVRIIAATNRDLMMQTEGRYFRSDLYYRLCVFQLFLPPLRERKQDIPLLISHYLRKLCARYHRKAMEIDAGGMECLLQHSWPGNVRELRNLLERVVVLTEKSRVAQETICSAMAQRQITPAVQNSEQDDARETKEQESISLAKSTPVGEEAQIRQVLTECRWNITKAAKRLRMARSTLYKKISDYQIQ